jgi:branched-chain amino acid aminotransferase
MGVSPKGAAVHIAIAAWPWGAYLGEEGKQKGIRAKISSWRRISPAGLIPHAKASGQYLNSILAKTESANAGYDEAILLDERGFVCEGSGENIYLVREGEIVTPGHGSSILDGINRKSVIQLARDLGYTVVERDVARPSSTWPRRSLLTGTAAELVPVREIDDHDLGEPARSPASSRPSSTMRFTAGSRSTASGLTRSESRPGLRLLNRPLQRWTPRRSGNRPPYPGFLMLHRFTGRITQAATA